MKSKLFYILLTMLPLYGILISSFNTALLFLLNPVAMTIQSFLHLPFFYDKSMYQYEWFTIPFFMIVSNLVFWMPAAVMINRYVERRRK